MLRRFVATVTILSMLGTVPVQAKAVMATISQMHGKVLVNHGKGFAVVAQGSPLNAGDVVMVGDGSAAVVSYADCAVSIIEREVVTISSKIPCHTGAVPTSYKPTGAFDPTLPLLFVGGVAVIGGVVLLGNKYSSLPVSAP